MSDRIVTHFMNTVSKFVLKKHLLILSYHLSNSFGDVSVLHAVITKHFPIYLYLKMFSLLLVS